VSLDWGAVSWACLASASLLGLPVGVALRAYGGRPWLWPVVAALIGVYLAVGWRFWPAFRRFIDRTGVSDGDRLPAERNGGHGWHDRAVGGR